MALKAYPINQFEDEFDYRFRLGFEEGFNKTFSLEDVKKAINMARLISDKSTNDEFGVEDISGLTEICTYDWKNKYSNEDIIKSLQLDKLPKEFIIEYNEILFTNGIHSEYLIQSENLHEVSLKSPKIILSSKGKKQICGTYKW